MFVQVITAKVTDPDGLSRQVDRWEKEVRPGAEGFLGSTSGITDDGRLVVAARFESEEAARRNSDRPEQGAWWAETEKLLQDVSFDDSSEVIAMGSGNLDSAGFVQVMRGRVADRAKADQMLSRQAEFEAVMADHRPDFLGDVTSVHADGRFTDVAYFTSEAEAREGESKEMTGDAKALFEDFMSAFVIEEYLDLKQPRLL